MTTSDPNRPGDQHDDEAFARLSAADPAAGQVPDEDAIRATVAAQVPLGAVPGGTGEAGDPVGGPRDELAARRARRRRAPLQVAAAVAGVLVVGGAGYAFGASGLGGSAPSSMSDTAVGSAADAPIELQEGSGAAPAQDGAADGAMRNESADSAGASVDSSYAGGWWGRTVFHQDGLPTDRSSAQGWAYDAAAVVSADTARRAAEVLGVEGEPVEDHGGWFVGAPDWDGPVVSLQADGLASLSFNDPTKDPWTCLESLAGGDPVDEGAVDVCTEPEHGAAPAGDEAESTLRDVLVDLGVDADAYELAVDEQGETGIEEGDTDDRSTYVSAYEVVDGQRTGATWSGTFSGAGLFQLYGSLAPRVSLGSYDVVSAAEAVERLGDPRFTTGGPVAYGDGAAESRAVEPEEIPTVPSTVTPGSPIAWPVADVTITDARLGLAVQYQSDGAAVLVPAYELTDARGTSWSVVAVVDEQLDFSVPSTP
ncbi:hypothetical protein IF650_08275 [Cellulosimicrobium terreum]|nr:hypothetical protein [Cellulosimicrobium terreum]